MQLDLLPWLGFASQVAGALVLFFSGGLGIGRATRRACDRGRGTSRTGIDSNAHAFSARGVAVGLALFGAGCASLAVFAVFERHFLLTGAQCLALVLVFAGVVRKGKGRRNGS